MRTASCVVFLGLLASASVAFAQGAEMKRSAGDPKGAPAAQQPPMPLPTAAPPSPIDNANPWETRSSTPAPARTADANVAPSPAAPVGPAPVDVTKAEPEPPPPAPKPWRFSGTIAVVSLPRVLNLEVLARFRNKSDPRWDLFGVGAGIEYLPKGLVEFGGPKLSWLNVGVDGRYHPWRYVFVGARIGYQLVRADSEKFGTEIAYLDKSFVIAPKAGILHTFDSGLTVGGELGVTIPIAPSSTHTTDDVSDSGARKAAKTFGEFVIPFVTAFRIGYTFQ